IRFLVLPQNLCDRRRHVVHVDRLEPRLAVAEYRIGWHGPQQPENCRKKCIIRREHYCWADNDCAGKCGLHGRFTLAAAADIERRRGRIGADPRYVHKTLNPRLSRSSCDFGGRFDVHRMKSVTSVLNIETDRVDNTVGTGNDCLHGTLVMRVRGDLLDSSVLAWPAMPRDCAHSGAGIAQMAHDTT